MSRVNKGDIALVSKAIGKTKGLLTELKSLLVARSRDSSSRRVNKGLDNGDQAITGSILSGIQAGGTNIKEIEASEVAAVVEEFAHSVKLLGSTVDREDVSSVGSGNGEFRNGLVSFVDSLRASEVGVEGLAAEISGLVSGFLGGVSRVSSGRVEEASSVFIHVVFGDFVAIDSASSASAKSGRELGESGVEIEN